MSLVDKIKVTSSRYSINFFWLKILTFSFFSRQFIRKSKYETDQKLQIKKNLLWVANKIFVL